MTELFEPDHVFSVAALSDALRKTVEQQYSVVRVRGEVSGVTRAASGHVYFTLKDNRAALDAVCWRGTAAKFGAILADGAELTCYGKLTTYAGRSKYQIIVSGAEPIGEGALMALLEQRKKTLIAEGLCDASRKRPLPFLPDTIGMITSPTGAVIRDMLHRLQDRFPRPVLLWPTAVQGEQAEAHILAAFASVTKLIADHAAADADTGPRPNAPIPDIIILARGGGSVEDLWTFNSEHIARAVAACPVPVISAVGHETDTTLVDFVSDVRAPTPTGAAELAVPHRDELYKRIDDHEERSRAAFRAVFSRAKDTLLARQATLSYEKNRYFHALRLLPGQKKQHIDEYFRIFLQRKRKHIWHIPAADARMARYMMRRTRMLEQRFQRVTQITERLYANKRRNLRDVPPARTALLAPFERRRSAFSRCEDALHPTVIRIMKERAYAFSRASDKLYPALAAVSSRKHAYGEISAALPLALSRYIREHRNALTQAERVLKQCSHKAILDKGYAVIRQQGRIITRAAYLDDTTAIDIEFTDGTRSA